MTDSGAFFFVAASTLFLSDSPTSYNLFCTNCGGELVVLGTRLLSGSAHGRCLLTSRKVREQKEVLEAKDDEEKESELDGEVEERERESLNVRMKHGDDDEINKAQT